MSKQSDEYFQGAAVVAARFTQGKAGKRRAEALTKASRAVCPQGITGANFEALVDKA